ncbi:MAG TPA: ribosome silencing factor [Steroidobacteraceae bacterium]|nr:ribosome silencing factor [Steroidobacteraceae bacterium]
MTTPRDRAPHARHPQSALQRVVTTALDDMKATEVKVLDVRGLTDIADTLIIASGHSDRHVRSIAERVVERVKLAGIRPLGLEGEREGEWVLVDLNDLIVHVMLPRVRELYALEHLWEAPEMRAAAPRRAAGRRAPD